VSEGAHVLLPYHRWLETLDGDDIRVGTTKRGVGPAYADKAGRIGIRMYELMQPARLERRLDEQVDRLEKLYRGARAVPPQPLDTVRESWLGVFSGLAHRLRPHVADTVALLHDALARGEKILCEGAQGTFLDVDLGTYPYVTSSTTTAGGASFGLGLPPSALRRVVGICKAYATRVGEGPFTSELPPEEADALRDRGSEFGATTGRPRRPSPGSGATRTSPRKRVPTWSGSRAWRARASSSSRSARRAAPWLPCPHAEPDLAATIWLRPKWKAGNSGSPGLIVSRASTFSGGPGGSRAPLCFERAEQPRRPPRMRTSRSRSGSDGALEPVPFRE
jgi:hypothetical protein